MHTFKTKLVAVFLVTTLQICSGCSHLQFPLSFNMESSANELARKLTLNLPPHYLATSTLVATPVEATTLVSGKFGLAMQELLIGSLSRYGATITEVQLRKVPIITEKEGFLYLTRNAKKIQDKYKAGMVVVSSYIIREHDIVITCRMIMLENNTVLAASTSTLYRGKGINTLLQEKIITPEAPLYER